MLLLFELGTSTPQNINHKYVRNLIYQVKDNVRRAPKEVNVDESQENRIGIFGTFAYTYIHAYIHTTKYIKHHNTGFHFEWTACRQLDGVAMASPLGQTLKDFSLSFTGTKTNDCISKLILYQSFNDTFICNSPATLGNDLLPP